METKAYYHLDSSQVDDNARLEMAIRYATECHKGQTRKGTNIWRIIRKLRHITWSLSVYIRMCLWFTSMMKKIRKSINVMLREKPTV